MDFEKIDSRLLSHPGASKGFHKRWGWMVYWVGSRQFACELRAKPGAKEPYAGQHLLSLKCAPGRIPKLRAEYPDAILPSYYSNDHTWISVDLDAGLPDNLVLDLCDMSYSLVFEKLPNEAKREIERAAAELNCNLREAHFPALYRATFGQHRLRELWPNGSPTGAISSQQASQQRPAR